MPREANDPLATLLQRALPEGRRQTLSDRFMPRLERRLAGHSPARRRRRRLALSLYWLLATAASVALAMRIGWAALPIPPWAAALVGAAAVSFLAWRTGRTTNGRP